MGFFFPLLLLFLAPLTGFTSILKSEVETRFHERFGPQIVDLIKKDGFLEEDSFHDHEIQAMIEQVERKYWQRLLTNYAANCIPLLKNEKWKALFERVNSLPDSIEKMSLFFSIYKALKLLTLFPALTTSSYECFQIILIQDWLESLYQARTLDAYPAAGEKHGHVRFIKNIVFKGQLVRSKEIGCYELACMLGIEEVFTACLHGFFSNQKGVVQCYVPTAINKNECYWFTNYRWIRFSDYLLCALGVLFFASDDMYSANLYFVPLDNGYFRTGFFDTEYAFTKTSYCRFSERGYPVFRIPFSWIGFDYPQYQYAFKKQDLDKLTEIGKRIDGFQTQIKAYLKSGFCETFLSEDEQLKFFSRIDLMAKIIKDQPKKVQEIHLAFLPEFSMIQEKLWEFFPQFQTMYAMHRIVWKPWYTLAKLSKSRRQELLDWIEEFLKTVEVE